MNPPSEVPAAVNMPDQVQVEFALAVGEGQIRAEAIVPTVETVRIVPMPMTLSSALYKIGRMLPGEANGWIPLVFLMAWMKMGATPGDSFTETGPELLAAFPRQCSAP